MINEKRYQQIEDYCMHIKLMVIQITFWHKEVYNFKESDYILSKFSK